MNEQTRVPMTEAELDLAEHNRWLDQFEDMRGGVRLTQPRPPLKITAANLPGLVAEKRRR